MDHQQPGLVLSGIAERVPGAAGNQNEPLRPDLEVLTLDGDRHQTVEDEVRLRAVHVAVRRRAAAGGGEGGLPQRESGSPSPRCTTRVLTRPTLPRAAPAAGPA